MNFGAVDGGGHARHAGARRDLASDHRLGLTHVRLILRIVQEHLERRRRPRFRGDQLEVQSPEPGALGLDDLPGRGSVPHDHVPVLAAGDGAAASERICDVLGEVINAKSVVDAGRHLDAFVGLDLPGEAHG